MGNINLVGSRFSLTLPMDTLNNDLALEEGHCIHFTDGETEASDPPASLSCSLLGLTAVSWTQGSF